jgi:hypothetical protein
MSHRYHEYFDLYCCLPHEFLVSYPQPRSSFDYQQIKYRNTNAVERTSSSRLSKYKPKNLLDPYKRSKDHYANEMHTVRRRMINKIMSIESSDHEVELTRSDRHDDPSQMADGDKKVELKKEVLFLFKTILLEFEVIQKFDFSSNRSISKSYFFMA